MEIVNDSFENEASPYGKKWEKTSPLNPKYLDYKKKMGKGKERILHISGHLVHSIDFETTSDSVTLGTNLVYAPIHQFGGRAGRGHKSKIPARPFLPVTKEAELYENVIEDIVEIFKDYLVF
jgi:phage virion morphogenesis protein